MMHENDSPLQSSVAKTRAFWEVWPQTRCQNTSNYHKKSTCFALNWLHEKTPGSRGPWSPAELAEADDPPTGRRPLGRLTGTAVRRDVGRRSPRLQLEAPEVKEENGDGDAAQTSGVPSSRGLRVRFLCCVSRSSLPGLSPAGEFWESRAAAFVLTKTLIRTGA